jgi:ribonuclease Z
MAEFLALRLLNGPGGDPGLLADLVGRRRALLFDLGRCDGLETAEVLRVTDIFVTHTHIDHFIGFDSVLRAHLARRSRLRLHGAPPLLENVAGRLRGYTWNLVTDESPDVEVRELDAAGRPVRAQRFRCAERFAPGPIERCDGPVAFADDVFTVRAAPCDHHDGISVAWRIDEHPRWSVDPTLAESLGGPAGPWVTALKDAARAGSPPDTPVATARGSRPLGDFVAAGALRCAPGDSLAYVTDVAWTERNRERLVGLCSGVRRLYCEGGFLDRDADHARRVSHLTAANAGALARAAGAAELRTFHYSRRYYPDYAPLIAEAEQAFRG